jgi:hypothetical protein
MATRRANRRMKPNRMKKTDRRRRRTTAEKRLIQDVRDYSREVTTVSADLQLIRGYLDGLPPFNTLTPRAAGDMSYWTGAFGVNLEVLARNAAAALTEYRRWDRQRRGEPEPEPAPAPARPARRTARPAAPPRLSPEHEAPASSPAEEAWLRRQLDGLDGLGDDTTNTGKEG